MSKRFSKQVLATIHQRLDLLGLISQHVKLKQASNKFVGLCPFHQEKTPSFTVSPQKNMYYCFGCHKHGDALDFYLSIHNYSFVDGIQQLCQDLAIPLDNQATDAFTLLSKVTTWCQEQLTKQPLIQQQLLDRNIQPATLTRFHIGFMPNQSASALARSLETTINQLVEIGIINPENQRNRFSNRIIIPIYDEYGQPIGFGGRSIQQQQQPKYLNSPETKFFKKKEVVFGLHRTRKAKRCILVEGFMDVVKLNQDGFEGAVALMGTSFHPETIQKLSQHFQQITLCYDGDQAGQTATNKLALTCLTLLGPHCDFNIVRLPEDHDPDSYIDAHGTAAMQTLIDEAKPLIQDVIDTLSNKTPLNKTIEKSKFKDQFLKLAEKIPDSVFRKEFKDLGFAKLYTPKKTNTPIQPTLDASFNWKVHIASGISTHPHLCHTLSHDEQNLLKELINQKDPQLKFIAHMVSVILKNDIQNTESLLSHAKKPQTKEKIKELTQGSLALSAEHTLAELKSALPRIEALQAIHLQEKLMEEAKKRTLTPDERQALIELIRKNNAYKTNK